MAIFLRLLTLFAVLLLPLGMAPAAASPMHHAMTIDMPKDDCPGQAPKHDMKGGIAECTMACAAALPAVDLAKDGPLMIVCEPLQPAAAQQLRGLHPETATPPPKRS